MQTRRWRYWLLLPLLVLVLAGTGTLAWLLHSERGAALGLAWLQSQLGDRLVLTGVHGTLAGPLRIERLQWHADGSHLQLNQIELDWSLAALWRKHLHIRRLQIATVALASDADTTPSTAPTALILPLSLQLDALQVLRIQRHQAIDFSDAGRLLLEQLRGTASSDGVQHQLALSARHGDHDGDVQAALNGHSPFALQLTAAARLASTAGLAQLAVQMNGSLLAMRTDAQLRNGDQEAQLHAVITPWQTQPIEQWQLQLTRLNLADFIAGAPVTALTGELRGAVDAAFTGSGELQLHNEQPGPWDLQRLPIRTLTTPFTLTAEALQAEPLQLQIADGGSAAGALRWQWQPQAQLDLNLRLQDLDPSRLHSRVQATRLAGELTALMTPDRQTVQANVSNRDLRLDAAIELSAQQLTIKRANLRGKAGQLDLKGELSLTDSQRFVVQANARALHLHRLLQLPETVLNSKLNAAGALAPALQARVNYALHDSRFAGQALTGEGELNWLPPERIAAAAELRLGGNQLTVNGVFGAADDVLELDFKGRDLQLPFLQGSAALSARVHGGWQQPAGRMNLHVPQLRSGDWLITALHGEAQFSSAPEAPIDIALRLTELNHAGEKLIADSELLVQGSGGRHQLTLTTEQAGEQARLQLQGGWQRAAARWQGELTALSWPGTWPLELSAPAPLQWDWQQQQFGPATFAAGSGQLQLETLEHRRGRWQSRGRLRDWPIQPWLPESMQHSDLQLDGEWNVQATPELTGNIQLFRQRGDLRWRNGSEIALGLQQLQALLYRDQNNFVLTAVASGDRLGSVQAALTYPTVALQALDTSAPIGGVLLAELPDIAWLGPLLSPSFVTAGRVQADVNVGGTASLPMLSGTVVGDALQFASLGTGLQLLDGRMRIQLQQQQAVLQQLQFRDGSTQAPPRSELARITPGGLTGSGQWDWFSQRADVQLQLERLGVLQLPNQWMRLSGTAQAHYSNRAASITGSLRADGGALALADSGRPALSDDVVIVGQTPRERSAPISVALDADLGDRFYFSGSGLDARLIGRLRFSAVPGNPLRANGTIETVDGMFDAYGQRLAIERGRLNFAGLIDNPGLDVLAMRRNQPVPAGVAVTGTVLQPRVQLVSEPELPEAEKLSWLVLGKGLSDVGPGDPGLLMTAGLALLGDSGGGTLARIQQQLGITVGLRTGNLGGGRMGSRSRLLDYSNTGSATSAAEIASIAKTFASKFTIGFEQVLGTGESVMLISWALSRSLSLEARSGTDNALDLFYSLRFGR
ncbi:MAG: translocation/assembly module TamB domain-containing protein [Pseudomonadota bacterium]